MIISTSKWIKVLLVNFILIFSGLIVIELFMGTWVSGVSYGRLMIPKSITQEFDISKLYHGNKSIFIRDQYGLRGNYGTTKNINILTVGGSTTNELFITEGKTWSDLLAQHFRDAGEDIYVANAGVDGQTTIGHIKNFELWFNLIPGLKPQYVLLYVGINDSALANGYPAREPDYLENTRRPFRQFFKNHSAIYNMYRNFRGMILARNANLIHGSDNPRGFVYGYPDTKFNMSAHLSIISKALESYAQRLTTLIGHIRKIGAKPIIVTQIASVFKVDRDGNVMGRIINGAVNNTDIRDYATLFEHNKTAMSVCKKLDGICIDLAQKINFVSTDYYDGIHTTPSGSAKIARLIFNELWGTIIN